VGKVERIRARLLSLGAGAPLPGAAGVATAMGASTNTATSVAAGAGVATGAGIGADAGTGAVTGAGEPLKAYQDLKAQVLAAVPTLFSAVPRAEFEIRAVSLTPWAPRLPAYQSAAPDGRTPAILYVDAASSTARPANLDISGFLQEAIPGRHFQSAFQQERADLPKFRRFGTDPAFDDGWALYAASLGEELGLYRDDEARRGVLLRQLGCATALVVDTGLHAMDWTSARAADYLRQQLSLSAADADLVVDRFVALPGDSLACTMGQLKIQALRNRAQQVLGARFDIHEFHSEILKDGSMPLDILEAKMNLWLDAH
jgi:uncharacterized protein (DUF885 family)